ncbi:unnamed protein product [Rhizopus stolonifer]
MSNKYRVAIEYCPKCRWMMRAAWMGQELLTTFENEISELALIPSDVGVFKVTAGDETSGERCHCTEKALGHSDKKKKETEKEEEKKEEECKTCPKD